MSKWWQYILIEKNREYKVGIAHDHNLFYPLYEGKPKIPLTENQIWYFIYLLNKFDH